MSGRDKILTIENGEIGYTSSLIENVNLSIYETEIIGLTGLNGSGKTTFLKTLLKEIKLLNGSYKIEGKFSSEIKVQDFLSVVYTKRINALGLTVRDILEIGLWDKANWRGKLAKKESKKIVEFANLLNLTELLPTSINYLSDGQFQKVMIAKALIQDTPIILLDEPTAFLDVKNKLDLFKLLEKLKETKKKTIIVSTHDIEFCKQYCDRILVIKNKSLLEVNVTDIENHLLND